MPDYSDASMWSGGIEQDHGATEHDSFDRLGLDPWIQVRLESTGFVRPTPIQASVIPLALAGRDVIGLAQTGSGKTAAFVLPLVQTLGPGQGVRGLVVSPTREIALQTQAFIDLFRNRRRRGRSRSRSPGATRGVSAVSLVGGLKIDPQIEQLRRHPDVLVVTPGRLLDHVERRTVSLAKIEVLVLDEADHMLDLGFLPQIQRILQALPEQRQTMMFSATMPPPIERLSARFLHQPELVDFRPQGRAAAGIEHRLYLVDDAHRKDCLVALLAAEPGSTLVFARRRSDAEWLWRVLENSGVEAERIHSDRSQAQRLRALNSFRDGRHRVLVATDVAARGIDIPAIAHVINFALPDSVEDYVHRAGRTARGSSEGKVSTIASWRDKTMVRQIERGLGQELPRCEVEGVEPYRELNRKQAARRRSPLRR